MYYVKSNKQTLEVDAEDSYIVDITLRNIKPFSEIHPDNMKDLLASYKIRSYKKRELIYSDWSNNKKIFFIIDGAVISFKYNNEGNKLIYFTYGKHDFICVGNLFDEIQDKFSVQSVSDSIIISWPKEIIEKLMKRDASFGWELAQIFSQRLDRLSNQIEILKLKTSMQRFSKYLLEELKHSGTDKEHIPYIKLNFNNTMIASYISVSRETVSRIITKLKKEKIIRVKKNILLVDNLKKLKSLEKQI